MRPCGGSLAMSIAPTFTAPLDFVLGVLARISSKRSALKGPKGARKASWRAWVRMRAIWSGEAEPAASHFACQRCRLTSINACGEVVGVYSPSASTVSRGTGFVKLCKSRSVAAVAAHSAKLARALAATVLAAFVEFLLAAAASAFTMSGSSRADSRAFLQLFLHSSVMGGSSSLPVPMAMLLSLSLYWLVVDSFLRPASTRVRSSRCVVTTLHQFASMLMELLVGPGCISAS